jgi:hypothetical protein
MATINRELLVEPERNAFQLTAQYDRDIALMLATLAEIDATCPELVVPPPDPARVRAAVP